MPYDVIENYTEWTLPDIEQFTNNVVKHDDTHTVTGSGLFDILMDTATKHLIAQYEGNRIRSEDYADAYVAIYQSTLTVAADLWAKKALEKINLARYEAEIKKIEAETLTESMKPALVQAETDKANAETQTQLVKPDLIRSQIAKTEAQVLLIGAQKENTEATTKTEEKKPALVECQTKLACAQAESEKYKLDLIEAQVALAEAQVEAEKAKLPLLEAQIELTAQQVELAKEQARSELAKRDLYRRQIEGFDEDYKQKLLKIAMDSWAVGFSVAKDSFEATGIPAPMQKVTIDDLYNDYILTDLDKYTYKRTDEVLNGYPD